MKRVCLVSLCLILSCVLPASGSFAWQRDGVHPLSTSRTKRRPELQRLTEKQREVHREEGRKRVRERKASEDKRRKSVNSKPKVDKVGGNL